MTNTLLNIFTRRLAHLEHEDRVILTRAYEHYLMGHIPEGFRLLGIDYSGQGAADLLHAIEGEMSK